MEKRMKKAETVGEITRSRQLLTFRPEEKIEHVVHEMIRHRQGAVGITEESSAGPLAGLLTERDILRKIFGTHGETQAQHDARHHRLSIYPASLLARDVMTRKPVVLTEDMAVDAALDKIKREGFRFMPVVKSGDKTRLVGIVSERELFWHTQEKLRRTIEDQSTMLSYFIQEPYGCGRSMEFCN
jgi:CBS domain-containing protein